MKVTIILIPSQLTHLKPTSRVVYLNTFKGSILLRTLPFHLSVLKSPLRHVLETLLSHHTVSTITHFRLSFPKESISPAATSSEEYMQVFV
jgi:hypothetical protein